MKICWKLIFHNLSCTDIKIVPVTAEQTKFLFYETNEKFSLGKPKRAVSSRAYTTQTVKLQFAHYRTKLQVVIMNHY